MEKKKDKKTKQKLKSSQKKIARPSSEYETQSIRSVFFDLEGDLVYNTIKHIRSYKGSGKIPEEEMELVWPLLKTKSLLFLQANAHELFDESTREKVQQLDPFQHDDPKILSSIELLNNEKYEGIYTTMHSIWTTKEEYVANFKPATLALFKEHFLSPEALSTLKNQIRTPIYPKSSDAFPMFSEMPADLIWCIVSHLQHPVDIINLAKCNKVLREVCNEPLVWNRMCTTYNISVNSKNFKKVFAAYYLQPTEQIMYSHEGDNFKYCHIVIPSEELRVINYSIMQQKYMLDDITALVLVVNMRHFDKRLDKYKYHPNYIHENVGFLRELIPEAAKYYRTNRCAFVVQLVDSKNEVIERIRTSKIISEDFPNIRGDPNDPKSVLQHIVVMFKELSFDVAAAYGEGWKPEMIVQYEDDSNMFFVDNFLRILRYIKLRPLPDQETE